MDKRLLHRTGSGLLARLQTHIGHNQLHPRPFLAHNFLRRLRMPLVISRKMASNPIRILLSGADGVPGTVHLVMHQMTDMAGVSEDNDGVHLGPTEPTC